MLQWPKLSETYPVLDIRIFRPKRKGIRVDVFRKYKHKDKKGKPKTSYKQLGSFPLQQGYSSDLIALLEPIEVLELQNWLAEAHFAEEFKLEATDLSKHVIRIPTSFHDTLINLNTEARRVNIDFVPHKIMLESLLKTAKLVQRKIDKVNGFNSGILEKIGIQSDSIIQQHPEDLQEEPDKILFKTLLTIGKPLGQICTELENAAKQYNKIKKIPPPQLREWAGDMPNRDPNKRIKKWQYAIAIDVLRLHSKNPIDLIAPKNVAEYWAIQRQEKYTLDEAIKKFMEEFQVPETEKNNVIHSITRVYKKTISLK